MLENHMKNQLNDAGNFICDDLAVRDWKEYPDQFREYARTFYKRFDTPTVCAINDDKPGIQVCIAVSSHREFTSMELDICGGLPDGTSIKIHNYTLPNDVDKVLALIPRLLAVWECAANHKIT